MGKRGRKPYPGLLTEREQEVLAFLRLQLTNAEIAERIGIAKETVKWHVSEILTKLGVATREEAAAWTPEPAPVRRWTGLGAPWWWRVAGAGVTAAAMAGVAALGWGVLSTPSDGGGEAVAEARDRDRAPADDGESLARASPGASLIATVTPTPPIVEAAGVGFSPTPQPSPAALAGTLAVPTATPTPQGASEAPEDEFTPPPTPTPTPTGTPTPRPPSTEFDTPPTPPTCDGDQDCDGFSDEIEIEYGSLYFLEASTPENALLDEVYFMNTCSDGRDNNLNGYTDGQDYYCGGPPTPTPASDPTPTPPPFGP